MKTIGTALCLLVFPLGGWLLTSAPPVQRDLKDRLTGLLKEASAARRDGDYDRASKLFAEGRKASKKAPFGALEARFLWGEANCHFSRRQYREALSGFLIARNAFARLGDAASTSALNGSLASLYSQIGETDAALDAVRRARTADKAPDTNGRRARLLLLHATLLASAGRGGEAESTFRQGIEEAARFDDADLLANGYDRLGSELLLNGRLGEAEPPLLEAFRLRKLNKLPSLAGSYRHIGLLRMEQRDFRAAAALLDASVAESASGRGRVPLWRFYHARGKLRLAEGRLEAAYREFALAVELARNERLAAPEADAARVGIEGQTAEAYTSLAETAAKLYFRTGAEALVSVALEAIEENRAASLWARSTERLRFRAAASEEYWQALAELGKAESAALVDPGEGPRAEMRRLRAEILEMEARAGDRAGTAGQAGITGVVERARRKLSDDAALLVFHLGSEESLLWTVDPAGVSLSRIAGAAEIEALGQRLRTAIVERQETGGRLASELHGKLFGAVSPRIREKREWLLSLEGSLFEVPFAALRDESGYLVERRTFRVISGAAHWLSGRDPRAGGGFLGVGDAVYNAADPRRSGAGTEPKLALARLPGSGEEIQSCAREWGGEARLLSGSEVTVASVRQAADGRPAVLHFATHVLRESGGGEPRLALGFAADGRPATLGAAEIAAWDVDSALVVMSGCGPALGRPAPGAGLMGLTRAWLMAGASAVAASTFAAPDDSGALFRAFYRALRRSPGDAATAMRTAQIAMVREGGWRAHPAYWGGYFVWGDY